VKAALGIDDPAYPASWQGEHFPKLAKGEIKLNGHPGKMHGPDGKPIDRAHVANTWAP
jgi:hypothetical protein